MAEIPTNINFVDGILEYKTNRSCDIFGEYVGKCKRDLYEAYAEMFNQYRKLKIQVDELDEKGQEDKWLELETECYYMALESIKNVIVKVELEKRGYTITNNSIYK